MFAISVGASLMHAAIDTGLADRTGLCCVFENGIEGILLVPWGFGVQLPGERAIVCDQQASLLQRSRRLLHVDTLFDGTSCHFVSVL
jgi:hypothetical protein